MSVLLATSLGDVVVDLHADRCPLTAKNFLKLCKIKYYNNCLFHSVQKDFIAQTGDPSGKGTGGDSLYKFLYGEQARFFTDEIHPDLKHSKVGTVAMASAGENLNASQFYITLRDDLDYLDGKHTVFGEVAEGLDTLIRINEAYVDDKGRPYKNIRIKHTYILDDPFDDPPQLVELIPESSPELRPPEEGEEVRLEDDWVPMDEQIDPEELEKSLRMKEAHSRAVVLEMIGDIPEAEIKPPENVLFVCKLNPVTQEEDLEVIFSRFGKVISADIIRDFKTGDSLCYAFIEFETQEACEAAYFKMDNVLIDDRRIHVDFSQSVSRLWNQYRQAGSKHPGASQGKGHGCYNCGELDHIAKECPKNVDHGPTDAAPQKPKYVLKDTNRQLGDAGKSYDMIFDDNLPDATKTNFRHEDNMQGRNKDQKHSGRETFSSRERVEPDYYQSDRNERTAKIHHEERESKTYEKDRGSRKNRDIETYKEDVARKRYREDKERDRYSEDRSRSRDRYDEDRIRNRDRYDEDRSRTRDKYGEDRSRNRDSYGEHKDRDKYRNDRESDRHSERNVRQRGREEQEAKDYGGNKRYKSQRDSGMHRDHSDRETLRNDRNYMEGGSGNREASRR